MGTKKILRKMPLQKRVPLKRKHLPRPIQSSADQTSSVSTSVPLIEDIRDPRQLDAFLASHKQRLGAVLQKYLSQTTENAAFENKGINAFVKHCLGYVLEVLPTRLVSGEVEPVAACNELRGLVDCIIGLETGHKWVVIEWAKEKLKEYIETLWKFECPDKQFVVQFLFFIELVNGLMCAPEEIENPMLQALVSTTCRALQIFVLGSLDSAIAYFAILYELVHVCATNKQTLPESLALVEKLATFMTANMARIEAAPGANSVDKPSLFALMVSSQLTPKAREFCLLKGTLKLIRNISQMFAETRCYESAAGTVSSIVKKLGDKHPFALGLWESVKSKLIREVKLREKIKKPLQLHEEKAKEIASFEPIIEDDFLPFRSRVNNRRDVKSLTDEKKEMQKKKREKRTELRKTKKLSMLKEEVRIESKEKQGERWASEKKVQRKALDEDYVEYKKMMSSAHERKFDPNRKHKKPRLAGNKVSSGSIRTRRPGDNNEE